VGCFSSRRRHTRLVSDWSSDVCSSDLGSDATEAALRAQAPKATYLHLATHGYFAPPERRPAFTQDEAWPMRRARELQEATRTNQIGRASCRERAEMPVVGGASREKKVE